MTIQFNTDKEDWLLLSRHLFPYPHKIDKEQSRKFEAINFPTTDLLDTIDRMKNLKIFPFFQEIQHQLGDLPVVPPERFERHNLYATNPNPRTNAKWKGKGPCKWHYNEIIAALKDFLAAYHPIPENHTTNPEPPWYWCDLVALFCAKMVVMDNRNIERLRQWVKEISHRNFLSLLMYHSTEYKTNWYQTKNIMKQKVSDIGLTTPNNVTKNDIQARFDQLDGVKPTPKFKFPPTNSQQAPKNEPSWQFEIKTDDQYDQKQPPKSKLQHHLDTRNSRPSTALIDEHLKENLRQSKAKIEAQFEDDSLISFDKMDDSHNLDPNTYQPRIKDQSTIVPRKHYRDKFRSNNTTLKEFDIFSKEVDQQKTGLQRQTMIVNRDNIREVQKVINDGNRTHSNKFVTMRNLSFQWDELSSNDSPDDSNNTNDDPISELLKVITTQPVDTKLVRFVQQKSVKCTVSQINQLVTALLTGLSIEAIQQGSVRKILHHFPTYESLEFCILQPNTYSTSANWTPEESKAYRNYYKIPHKFSKIIRYDQVRSEKTFNLQIALQPYYDELESLKQEGMNPAILCKFFVEAGVDTKLKFYLKRHSLNYNYKPSSFKYIIEKLYCLEAPKISKKLDDKVLKFFNWNNRDKQTYKVYVDRFVRAHKRIIDLMILQDRLNYVQRFHNATHSPVDLTTRYNVPMHQIITRFVAGIAHNKLRQNVVKRIRRDVYENNRLTGQLSQNESQSLYPDVVPRHLPRFPPGFRIIPYLSNIIHNEGQKVDANDLRTNNVLRTITRPFRNSNNSSRNRNNNYRSNRSSRRTRSFSRGRFNNSFSKSRSRTPKRTTFDKNSRTPRKSILKNTKKSVSFGKTPTWRKNTSNKISNQKSNKKSFPKTKWLKPTYNDPKFRKLKSSNRHNSFKYNKNRHLKSKQQTNVVEAETPQKDDPVNDDGSVITDDVKTNLINQFDSGNDDPSDSHELNDPETPENEPDEPLDAPSSPSLTAEPQPNDDEPTFSDNGDSDHSLISFEEPHFATDDESNEEPSFSCVIQPVDVHCHSTSNIIPNKDIPKYLRDPEFEHLPPNVIAYRKLCKQLGSKHKIQRFVFKGKCDKCGSTNPRHRPNLCGKFASSSNNTSKSTVQTIHCNMISTNHQPPLPVITIDTKPIDDTKNESLEEKVDEDSSPAPCPVLFSPSPSVEPPMTTAACWDTYKRGIMLIPLHLGITKMPVKATAPFEIYSVPRLITNRSPICWKFPKNRTHPILFVDLGLCWRIAGFCNHRKITQLTVASGLINASPMPTTFEEVCQANRAIIGDCMELQYRAAYNRIYKCTIPDHNKIQQVPFSLYPKQVIEQITAKNALFSKGIPPMFWYKNKNETYQIFIDYYNINLLCYSVRSSNEDSNNDLRRKNIFEIMTRGVEKQSRMIPTSHIEARTANDHLWSQLQRIIAFRHDWLQSHRNPPFANSLVHRWKEYKNTHILPDLANKSQYIVTDDKFPVIYTTDSLYERNSVTNPSPKPPTNKLLPTTEQNAQAIKNLRKIMTKCEKLASDSLQNTIDIRREIAQMQTKLLKSMTTQLSEDTSSPENSPNTHQNDSQRAYSTNKGDIHVTNRNVHFHFNGHENQLEQAVRELARINDILDHDSSNEQHPRRA